MFKKALFLFIVIQINVCFYQNNGDKHVNTRIQQFKKFCFEQDYQEDEHYVINFSLTHQQAELVVKDRKNNIIFHRTNKSQFTYSFTGNKETYYHIICVNNLSKELLDVDITVKQGHRAGDKSKLMKKESKLPIENSIQVLENQITRVISLIIQDEKTATHYQNNKKDINKVSYLYGFMTLFTIALVGIFQVMFMRNTFIKKKLI